jgi:hypothetical protein
MIEEGARTGIIWRFIGDRAGTEYAAATSDAVGRVSDGFL